MCVYCVTCIWSINYGCAYAYQLDCQQMFVCCCCCCAFVCVCVDRTENKRGRRVCASTIQTTIWSGVLFSPLPFGLFFAHLDFYRLSLSFSYPISRKVSCTHAHSLCCFSLFLTPYLTASIIHFCFYSTVNIYFSSVTFTYAIIS